MRYWPSLVGRVLTKFCFFLRDRNEVKVHQNAKNNSGLLYGQNEIFLAGTKQEIPSGQDRPIFPACRTRPSDLMNILMEKKITFFNCGWFDFQPCSQELKFSFKLFTFSSLICAANHIVQNCCSERQNVFLCWGGSPRVPTHYPFIYRTIF